VHRPEMCRASVVPDPDDRDRIGGDLTRLATTGTFAGGTIGEHDGVIDATRSQAVTCESFAAKRVLPSSRDLRDRFVLRGEAHRSGCPPSAAVRVPAERAEPPREPHIAPFRERQAAAAD